MRRKQLLVLLLSLLTICLSFVACGKKEIALLDFPEAYSEQVQLGDLYTLKVLNVYDKNGNEYRVTAEVKTTQGEVVNVIGNQFDIDNIQGYVITYTAKISDKQTVKSVLTLNVVDKEGPVIRITKPSDGVVGEVYTLPSITVSDLSGEVITPTIKVFFVNGEEREEVTVTDKKFTPAKQGTYVIQVTAKDSSNNSNSKEETFAVYNPASEGEVANFDYAETVSKLTANKTVEFSYVSPKENQDATYKGGYVELKYDAENTWVNTYLVPRQAKAAYADYDLITVWIYPVVANDAKETCYFSFFNDINYRVEAQSGEWTKVSFSADKFLDAFDNLVNKSQIFLPINYNNGSSVNHKNLTALRMGNIFMHKYANFEVEVDNDSYISGGQTTAEIVLTVKSSHDVVPPHVLKVLDSENKAVQAASVNGNVYTFELPMGRYTYSVESANEVYVGSAQGSFNVENSTQIRLDGTTTNFVAGTQITIPDAQIWVNGQVTENVAVKNAKYVYAADNTEEEITGNTFTPTASGKIVVTYTYTDAVAVIQEYSVARGAINNRYVLDATSRDMLFDVSDFKTGVKYTKTYNNDGQKSYVAITVTNPVSGSNWVVVPIAPKNTISELSKYDYVRVEVYYVATQNSLVRGLFVSDKHIVTDLPTNQWITVDIPRDVFVANYATKHIISANFHVNNADYPNVTEIRLGSVYGVSNANLSVKVDANDLVLGQTTAQATLTVSSTNQTMPSYTLIVKGAQGNEIAATTVANNVYTFDLPAGRYSYQAISNDEIYIVGGASGEFVIEDAFKIVVDNYGSYVAGDEITLLDGTVYESGVATENVAKKTAKYVYAADNVQVDLGEIETYTPDASGKLVITYSYEGANDVIVEVTVTRGATKDGYILDGTRDARFDIAPANSKATVTYVSADENQDTTYSGGYHLVQYSAGGWCNINFSNNVNFEKQDLEGYDYISIWLYLEYKNVSENNHYISFYNVFEVNGVPTNYALKTNRWVKLNLNIDVFESKFDGLVGKTTKVPFMPFNFSASYLLGVRIGEIKLEKLDSIVDYNSETSKIEMNIASFENCDYTVSIKDNEGQAVTDFEFTLEKDTNTYEYAPAASGTYTVTVVYDYKYVGRNSSNVEVTHTYTVEKTYTVTVTL